MSAATDTKTPGGRRPAPRRACAALGALLAALTLPCACRSSAPAGAAAGRSAARPMPRPVRAIWVARFHYRYPADVRAILRNCAKLGCNTVLWQVRGNGTVAYRSRIEPWSREFDFRDPGFDPLALAVAEAHRNGLRLEAWVNLLPGWAGTRPPPLGNQLYWTHPEWFLRDAAGQRQPLNEHYLSLNPCLPEVRRYLVRLLDEIVSNYDVDGIHLDYVRYAWQDAAHDRARYPGDARTLALYRQQTGRRPADDPAAWDRWRGKQLTRLVADIRRLIDTRRPCATLSAAVWSDPRVGYHDYFQNALAWLRSGLLDAAYPMAYTERPGQFARYIRNYRRLAPGCRVIPGLGIYRHKTRAALSSQLRLCAAGGGDYALFSYDALLETRRDETRKHAERQRAAAERRLRRAVLAEFR